MKLVRITKIRNMGYGFFTAQGVYSKRPVPEQQCFKTCTGDMNNSVQHKHINRRYLIWECFVINARKQPRVPAAR